MGAYGGCGKRSTILERKPSLTEQARLHIKEKIFDGAFEAGRIPSETELADELGVSRTTIRAALNRLESEGVIYRKQGSGTYVNEPGLQIKTRLEEIWSYEGVLQAHGYTPSTRILSLVEQPAGAKLAADLQIEPEEPVAVVEKLFLEDDEPVILTVNHVPFALTGGLLAEAVGEAPIYDVVAAHGRNRLSYYLSEIVPLVASAELGQRLRLQEGTPLISFSEIGYDDENEPLLKAASYFRDDLLRLRLIRRKG